MKSNISIIIIDDNYELDAPIIPLLQEDYQEVLVFNNPQEGTDFVIKNADTKRMILILDIKMPKLDGHQVLHKIREKSFNIPVILQSAVEKDKFDDFINNQAFAYLKRPTSMSDIRTTVKKAELFLDTEIEGAIEEWVKIQDKFSLDKPYIIEIGDKSYSLNDILREIRQQTEFGRQFQKDLIMATIDLLLKKKIRL